MPLYESADGSRVWALKIGLIKIREDGLASIVPEDVAVMGFNTQGDYSSAFKGSPEDQGYYAILDDESVSWFPTAEFEATYTKIN